MARRAMAQVGGYHLTADRGDRLALARLVNDLEQLPNSAAGSGGNLSPRLEAELINMLTRPTTRHDTISTAQTAQLAAIFGLGGLMIGFLIVAAAFWIAQLQGRIQEQTDSLKGLSAQVEQSSERLARFTDHSSAERRLLSDALQKTISDKKSPTFDQLYEKMYKELRDDLDAAKRKYETLNSNNEALAFHTRELESDVDSLRTKLAETTKERESFKIEKESAESQLAVLKKEAKEALASSSDAVDGGNKGAISQELVRTRYVAYGGWVTSAFGHRPPRCLHLLQTACGRCPPHRRSPDPPHRVRSKLCPAIEQIIRRPTSGKGVRVLNSTHILTLFVFIYILVFAAAWGQSRDLGPPGRETTGAIEPTSVDELAPVAVPEPTEKAMQYYHSGMWLWGLNRIWGLLVPGVLAFSGFSARLRNLALRLGKFWF